MWEGGGEGGERFRYRDALINLIRDNVEVTQNKFGGCTLLATESDPSVLRFIYGVELVLQDGLKPKSAVNLKNINLNVNNFSLRQVTELVSNGISMVMGPTNIQDAPVFWSFVRNHLTRHEQDRYYNLQHVGTDYGRGRSWLRSSINEHSLDRYLRMLFCDENLISNYYETSALIHDVGCKECLLDSARRLRSVIFALVVDRRELDQVDEQKQLLIRSLRPEPEAVLPLKPSKQQSPDTVKTQPVPKQPNKKSKVRIVDLEGDEDSPQMCQGRVEEAVEPFATASISIPENGKKPSLVLPAQAIGSSPSVQSFDSITESCPLNDAKHLTSTLNPFEMKQMLLDLTKKKNSLEDYKSSLQVQLNDSQLENRQLKDQLNVAEQQSSELAKENLILKEQLKKYMSAVQLLKNSSSSPPVPTSPTSPPPDFHQEAAHFEEKLVQIAEMHGELMEFNSYLQKQLQSSEILIDRMRGELVQLRGPLPSDYIFSRPPANEISDGSSLPPPPLIHVWIPSTFLVHGATDPHHIYQVYIRISDEEWTIYKRYSQFYKFRKESKKSFSFVASLNFPPKKNFGRQRDEKTVEDRRKRLQDFLREFLNLWTRSELQSSTLTKSAFIELLPFFG